MMQKKAEDVRDRKLQYNCIGERNYYSMCSHNNMVNIKVSSIPVEIIIKEFS